MTCMGCRREVDETWFGPWCEDCGGVMARPDFLLFRHVATVSGGGGAFAIVWDASLHDYVFIVPKPDDPTQPMPNPHANKIDHLGGGEFRRPPIIKVHGSLDAMIAFAQPWAKGKAEELPTLSAAPQATPEEKSIIYAEV